MYGLTNPKLCQGVLFNNTERWQDYTASVVGVMNTGMEHYGIINNETNCLFGDKRAIYKQIQKHRPSVSDKWKPLIKLRKYLLIRF